MTPPVISNFAVTEVSSSTISVFWTTDEPSDDQLRSYIGDALPQFSLLNTTPRTTHQVIVTNLDSDTVYTLIARSRDSSGNQTLSNPLAVRTLNPTLISGPPTLSSQRESAAPETATEISNIPPPLELRWWELV